MLRSLRPAVARFATPSRALSRTVPRRFIQTEPAISSAKRWPWSRSRLAWTSAALAASASVALAARPIYADALNEKDAPDSVVEEASGISFPKTLKIPSTRRVPDVSLLGVGVRRVSFLGVKVYAVGFYADLNNPALSIPRNATPEEKIEHIISNTTCVLRIVPTRPTSYSHLRDGFVRALTARISRAKLNPPEEYAIQAPMRKFKAMFPPSETMPRGQPMEIVLHAPGFTTPALVADQVKEELGDQRVLVVRDMDKIQNTWLAEEFVRAYFDGNGISPPMKKAVMEFVENL